MSHFTTVSVQIKDGVALRKCLEKMGYPILDMKTVRGYNGIQESVDFAIKPSENSYLIGFRKNAAGEYDVVADWWGVRVKEKEFMSKLKATFAEEKITQFAKKNRYTLKKSIEGTGTVIELVKRSY